MGCGQGRKGGSGGGETDVCFVVATLSLSIRETYIPPAITPAKREKVYSSTVTRLVLHSLQYRAPSANSRG
jgi:hypothetical protein